MADSSPDTLTPERRLIVARYLDIGVSTDPSRSRQFINPTIGYQWNLRFASAPEHGVTAEEARLFLVEAGVPEAACALKPMIHPEDRAQAGIAPDAPVPYQFRLSREYTQQVDSYVAQLLDKAPEKTRRIAELLATDAVSEGGMLTPQKLKDPEGVPDRYRNLFANRRVDITTNEREVRHRAPRSSMRDTMAELDVKVGFSGSLDDITYADLSGFMARFLPTLKPGAN